MGIKEIHTNKQTVLWGYIANFLSIASGLITLPLILKLLSDEEIGVYYLFITITSFTALFDLGFSPQISRNMSYIYSGADGLKTEGYQYSTGSINYGLLKGLISISKSIYRKIALLVFLCLSFLGTIYIYSVTKGSLSIYYILPVWLFYIVGTTLSMYYYYLTAFMEGSGEVKTTKKIIVISKAANILVICALLLLEFRLWAVVIGSFIYVAIYTTLSKRAFFSKELKDVLNSTMEDKSRRKELFNAIWFNAKKIAIIYLAGFCITRFSVFLSGLYLDLKSVASLGLLLQFISLISCISENFFLVSQPEIASLRVLGKKEELIKVFSRTMAIYMLLFVAGSLFLMIFVPKLLEIIRPNSILPPSYVIGIYCLVNLLERQHSTFAAFISTGNKIPYLESSVIAGIFIILFSYISLKYTTLGLIGLATVQGFVQLVYANWKWPYVALKELNISYAKFYGKGFVSLLSIIKK